MRFSPTLKWIGLALLGIAIASVVAVAASNLASRQIGLASEPISAGEALAPQKPHTQPRQPPPARTTSSPPPSPGAPTTPADPGRSSDDELEADD